MPAAHSDPVRIVEAGYDRVAETYLAWSGRIRDDPRQLYLSALVARLPANPAVLDLGCGAGVPSTAVLARYGVVTGVDLSASQLELARRYVPEARLVQGEMATVEFPPAAFDAVTAFYSIPHLPRDLHGALFQRIAGWLRPGGHLLAVLGSSSDPGSLEEDWLGAPMFFSSHDVPTNRRLLAEAGLTVLVDDVVTIREPEGPATFQWIIAIRADTEANR